MRCHGHPLAQTPGDDHDLLTTRKISLEILFLWHSVHRLYSSWWCSSCDQCAMDQMDISHIESIAAKWTILLPAALFWRIPSSLLLRFIFVLISRPFGWKSAFHAIFLLVFGQSGEEAHHRDCAGIRRLWNIFCCANRWWNVSDSTQESTQPKRVHLFFVTFTHERLTCVMYGRSAP